jgi:hypothetical protein
MMPRSERKFTKLPIYVHGLLCETIREEKTGSATFVGVFPDIMEVPSFPGSIAPLSAVLWISLPLGGSLPGPVTAILELPGNAPPVSIALAIPAPPDPAPGTIRRAITAKLRFGAVPILAAGKIRIIVDIAGKSYLAASLNIRQAAQPGTPS